MAHAFPITEDRNYFCYISNYLPKLNVNQEQNNGFISVSQVGKVQLHFWWRISKLCSRSITKTFLRTEISLTIDCFTLLLVRHLADVSSLIARFMGPKWGPSGVDRWAPCWPHVLCYLGSWDRPCPLEFVWKSTQKSCRKGRRKSHVMREILGNPMSIYRLTTNWPNKRSH